MWELKERERASYKVGKKQWNGEMENGKGRKTEGWDWGREDAATS